MEVSARDLRRNLASVLRRVAAGERVVITLRGRPLAAMTRLGEPDERLEPHAFGIWRDRADRQTVEAWLEGLRLPRAPGGGPQHAPADPGLRPSDGVPEPERKSR